MNVLVFRMTLDTDMSGHDGAQLGASPDSLIGRRSVVVTLHSAKELPVRV